MSLERSHENNELVDQAPQKNIGLKGKIYLFHSQI